MSQNLSCHMPGRTVARERGTDGEAMPGKEDRSKMWYVLQVMSGREADLRDLITRCLSQELLRDCFYPTYEAVYKKGGQRRIVQRRMFPGYLFIVTEDILQVEQKLQAIPDMMKVLKTGSEPIPLTREEQEFLERRLNREHVLPMSRGYKSGDEIRITEGPFAGYLGQLKAVDRHNRFGVISLEMFGRDVEMRFGLEVVGKV